MKEGHSYLLTKTGTFLAFLGILVKIFLIEGNYFYNTGDFILLLAVFFVVIDIAKAVEKH